MIIIETEWVKQKPAVPDREGWYRVMHPGDYESIDGQVTYDFNDYEGWAYWVPALPDELEEEEGGHKGTWITQHDEEGDMIFAYLGPFEFPAYQA